MPGTLANSAADVLGILLVDLGLGTAPVTVGRQGEWPVYTEDEPDTPDNCITIYDTEGVGRGKTMPDGEVQEAHGIQVRVRAKTHTVGFAKAREIAVTLDPLSMRTVSVPTGNVTNRYRIWSLSRIGDVLAIGKQFPANKRRLFTLNYLVSLRQLP